MEMFNEFTLGKSPMHFLFTKAIVKGDRAYQELVKSLAQNTTSSSSRILKANYRNLSFAAEKSSLTH